MQIVINDFFPKQERRRKVNQSQEKKTRGKQMKIQQKKADTTRMK